MKLFFLLILLNFIHKIRSEDVWTGGDTAKNSVLQTATNNNMQLKEQNQREKMQINSPELNINYKEERRKLSSNENSNLVDLTDKNYGTPIGNNTIIKEQKSTEPLKEDFNSIHIKRENNFNEKQHMKKDHQLNYHGTGTAHLFEKNSDPAGIINENEQNYGGKVIMNKVKEDRFQDKSPMKNSEIVSSGNNGALLQNGNLALPESEPAEKNRQNEKQNYSQGNAIITGLEDVLSQNKRENKHELVKQEENPNDKRYFQKGFHSPAIQDNNAHKNEKTVSNEEFSSNNVKYVNSLPTQSTSKFEIHQVYTPKEDLKISKIAPYVKTSGPSETNNIHNQISQNEGTSRSEESKDMKDQSQFISESKTETNESVPIRKIKDTHNQYLKSRDTNMVTESQIAEGQLESKFQTSEFEPHKTEIMNIKDQYSQNKDKEFQKVKDLLQFVSETTTETNEFIHANVEIKDIHDQYPQNKDNNRPTETEKMKDQSHNDPELKFQINKLGNTYNGNPSSQFKNEKHLEKLKTTPSEYRDDSQMGNTITGDLASEIIDDLFKKVNLTKSTMRHIGSTLSRRGYDKSNTYSQRFDLYKLEKEDFRTRSDKVLNEIRRLTENLIAEEVKSKSCNTLSPHLQDFLQWLLAKKGEQRHGNKYDDDNFLFSKLENHKDNLKKGKQTHKVCITDIVNGIHNINALLSEYDGMTENDQNELQTVHKMLRQQLDKLRHEAEEIHYNYDKPETMISTSTRALSESQDSDYEARKLMNEQLEKLGLNPDNTITKPIAKYGNVANKHEIFQKKRSKSYPRTSKDEFLEDVFTVEYYLNGSLKGDKISSLQHREKRHRRRKHKHQKSFDSFENNEFELGQKTDQRSSRHHTKKHKNQHLHHRNSDAYHVYDEEDVTRRRRTIVKRPGVMFEEDQDGSSQDNEEQIKENEEIRM